MIEEYEGFTSDLLKWIENAIEALNDRQFANSLRGVQEQLSHFNTYRFHQCYKTFFLSSPGVVAA